MTDTNETNPADAGRPYGDHGTGSDAITFALDDPKGVLQGDPSKVIGFLPTGTKGVLTRNGRVLHVADGAGPMTNETKPADDAMEAVARAIQSEIRRQVDRAAIAAYEAVRGAEPAPNIPVTPKQGDVLHKALIASMEIEGCYQGEGVATVKDCLTVPTRKFAIGYHAATPATEKAVEPVAYRFVHLDYAGRKVSRYGSHPERVNGRDPVETHPLYAHPPAADVAEADRQEALAKTYRQAQLTAEEKLCREQQNAKGWKKRAEYLESQLKAAQAGAVTTTCPSPSAGRSDTSTSTDVMPADTKAGPSAADVAGLREALEPFALMASEGVVSQKTGYVTVTTCADYFHNALAALTAASGESQ